jgi:hypothetical protein
MTKKANMQHRTSPPPSAASRRVSSDPLEVRIVRQLAALPRLVRILLCAWVGIVVTAAVSAVVDYLYLNFLFDESTRILPSLVSAGIGIIVYGIGWWLMVGSIGAQTSVRRASIWYLLVGVLITLFLIVIAISGYSTATGVA